MAAFDYSALAKTAASLMERFGTHGCRVLRPSSVDVDVDKPWRGQETAPDTVVLADATILPAMVSRTHVGGPSSQRMPNSLALTLEEAGAAFMCAGGDKVLAGDYVEFPLASGGVDRIVVTSVSPVKPGGAEIIWQLYLGT